MEKAKKILTYVALATMGVSVLMLILAIFGLKVFNGVLFKVLLSFATIAVTSAFSINALNILKTKNMVGYISLGLLGISGILGLIVYWTDFKIGILNQITGILAIATVFFCIIISLNNKIQKRYLILQIITYVVIILIDIILTLIILGVDVLGVKGMTEIFFTVCLIALGLLSAVAILGKKKDNNFVEDKKFIKVEKEEYDKLIAKIKELEEENTKLKQNLKIK